MKKPTRSVLMCPRSHNSWSQSWDLDQVVPDSKAHSPATTLYCEPSWLMQPTWLLALLLLHHDVFSRWCTEHRLMIREPEIYLVQLLQVSPVAWLSHLLIETLVLLKQLINMPCNSGNCLWDLVSQCVFKSLEIYQAQCTLKASIIFYYSVAEWFLLFLCS